MMKYFDWIAPLADIYLEDSFVLEIRVLSKEVEFELEFVLRESHPDYSAPKLGEQYCYRRGLLRFSDCDHIDLRRTGMVSVDADGETDHGNIDTFDKDGETILMSGDWGELSLVCNKVEVIFSH